MKNFNLQYGVYAIIALSFLIFWGIVHFFLSDKATTLDYAKLVPTIVTIDLVVVFLFSKWLWKIPLLRSWLVKVPNLNGTWKGEIKSNWVNPKTNESPDPIPVILTVEQSLFNISCVMRTKEMTSYSFISGFEINEENQIKRLAYSYSSRPQLNVRHRSPEHFGTIIFDIIEKPSLLLNGEYWTGRNTTGIIELTFWKTNKLDYYPDDLGEHPVSLQDHSK